MSTPAANPDKSTPTPSTNETRQCPVCGEQIWVRAQKCVHCQAELTWRRYLGFSSTTLALVTALIAVISASVPALLILFTPENSSLHTVFAGISTSGDTVSLLFSNRGRRVGAINRAEVAVTYVTTDHDHNVFAIYPETKGDAAISIAPGTTILVPFSFSGVRCEWMPSSAKKDIQSLADVKRPILAEKSTSCQAGARGVNADGTPYNEYVDIGCQDQAFQMFRKLFGKISDGSVSVETCSFITPAKK